MVDFMLNEMNLAGLIERIHNHSSIIDGVGMTKDELMMATLNADDTLKVPGGFTHKCLDEKINIPSMTRSLL